jgi:hypothetical protein
VAAGDGVHRIVCLGQGPAGRLDPDPLDIGGRRQAHLGGEPALQVPRAEAGLRGQVGDAVPAAGIGVHGQHRGPDRVTRGLRRPQRHNAPRSHVLSLRSACRWRQRHVCHKTRHHILRNAAAAPAGTARWLSHWPGLAR